MKLLTWNNQKTAKGAKLGILTLILHLAPARSSGYNVCPMASPGCIDACLNTAGRGRFERTQNGRIHKTKMFFEGRTAFMDMLVKDIRAGIRKAAREGVSLAIRLNGTSDIRWETVPVWDDGVKYDNIMTLFPDVTFYDYTKIPNRRGLPDNYSLTFSRSETNEGQIPTAFDSGMNVAVVFSGKKLPMVWNGRPVISGDDTDVRFMDPKGHIVGLLAKGDGKKDTSGFVVQV